MCECGNETVTTYSKLKSGETTSCGCVRYEDVSGQRFGKLVAIEREDKEKNSKAKRRPSAYWLCECDCGNMTVVELSNLKRGMTKSCGCTKSFNEAKICEILTKNEIKHIGGTGVGAGTLTNLCNKFCNANSFEDIIELSKQGDLSKIDLRIGDKTTEKIDTLPYDLTLSNFGNLSKEATNADIALGILNMIFEVIGMMAAFAIKNDTIKEVILIGNITVIPSVKRILKKIEETQNITFIVPENAEFGVVIGAIKSI